MPNVKDGLGVPAPTPAQNVGTTDRHDHTVSTGDRAESTSRGRLGELQPSAPPPADEPTVREVLVRANRPGRVFLEWLQAEIASGALNVHRANAPIRVVAEGVLLVTPEVFQRHSGLDWHVTQQQFLKLKLHRKTADGKHLHVYHDQQRPSDALRGVLVPDTAAVFGNTPAPTADSCLAAETFASPISRRT